LHKSQLLLTFKQLSDLKPNHKFSSLIENIGNL